MAFYNRFAGSPLQDWYQIEITELDGSKYVTFHSRIHVRKAKQCPFCWGTSFTDSQILEDYDLGTWIYDSYGSVHAQR